MIKRYTYIKIRKEYKEKLDHLAELNSQPVIDLLEELIDSWLGCDVEYFESLNK